jgi:hypothetical protein
LTLFISCVEIKLTMAKTGKDKFRIKSEKFPEFISKLEDLTKISDSIKIKIEGENTMMYSILGKATVLAFKNYNIPTNELFEMKDELEYGIDIVILNAKKFVKNLNFLKENEKVTIEITHKESQEDEDIMDARALHIVGGKLKLNWIGGEHYEIKDMNKSKLDQGLNLKNSRWSFNITKSDFTDIKKLSSINGERILQIGVKSGKVVISETSAWELEIDEIDVERNSSLILNKKFLGCINDNDDIKFHIFDNFMLVKHEDSNLMLSFEQNWDEEDI